ncbi:MAG: SDR family oxidoreductase [Gammaproteobacteria bacterium]|nr:SDR family oxidoreductase [Gammaproteobacteria bacterium]
MSALFEGKLVLITGAAQGIGRAILDYFIRHQAEIIIVDIDQNALQTLDITLKITNVKYQIIHCDVTDEKQVNAQFGAAQAHLGKTVDILINVAGGGYCERLQDSTATTFRQEIELNLISAYHCVEALRAGFIKKNKGVIINIGSVNGMTTLGYPCYSAAKAGLESYTKALAVEFGKYGIRANIVCPGSVKTRLWEDRAARNPDIFEDIKKWYPLGDITQPEDIAEAVGFLASDAARMITGIALPVDGGLLAGSPTLVESFTNGKL